MAVITTGGFMDDQIPKLLPGFLSTLGLDEEPMGLFYADEKLGNRSEEDQTK